MIITRRKFEEELDKARREVYDEVSLDRRFDCVYELIGRLEERVHALEPQNGSCTSEGCSCKVAK